MADRTLVLAIFDDEAAADAAASSLRDSELADSDAIGVLALNNDGDLKIDKVGARSTGKGAGIGAALWLLGPVGMVAGVAGGAAAGALHKKGLKLDDSDRDRISSELTDGKAAVGVLAAADHVDKVTARLSKLGGKPESHEVLEEALRASASDQGETLEPPHPGVMPQLP